MGATCLAFEAFRREQLARFPKPTYTAGGLAKAAKIPRWRIDEAIRKGKLPAFRYGDARNAQWTIEIADWIRFRWASSNLRPVEQVEPPAKHVARPPRGRPSKGPRHRLIKS
jgi:hypothetical protein